MKKTLIKIFLLLSFFTIFGVSVIETGHAEGTNVVKVMEKIPGGNCGEPDARGIYTCKVERGFGSVMTIMGKLIKYFTFIASLFAVLMLVVGGIMYSMGGAYDGMKTKSKEFIIKSLLGLIVLLLSGLFLYIVAPWVYVQQNSMSILPFILIL